MLTIDELTAVYRREQVLMVLISRLYFNTSGKAEVQEFINQDRIDWDLFYRITRAHAIRPFIYDVIRMAGLVTETAFERKLRQAILPLSMRNLQQQQYVGKLVGELSKIGVKAIPYKGVTFGNAYYRSSALRESSDIDLFIHKNDVKKVCDYFAANNYTAKPGEEISKDYMAYYIATSKDLVFKIPDNSGLNCSVEIQWRLVDPYIGDYPDYDFFIGHLKELITAGGNQQLQLAPTYDFLSLISHHFIKDSLTRFKFIVDAACMLTVKGSEIDAGLVLDVMRKYGYSKLFSASIGALNDLLGIHVPGFMPVNIGENPLIPGALAFPVIDKTRDLQHIRLFMSMQDTSWRRLRAWMRLRYLLLPNIRDINSVKLPVYLLPFFVVTRPFRLGYKYLVK